MGGAKVTTIAWDLPNGMSAFVPVSLASCRALAGRGGTVGACRAANVPY